MAHILLLLLLLLVLPGGGQAEVMDLGEPVLVGSWAQWFQEHHVGAFDTLAIEMVSPETAFFEAPGFLAFGSPGWTAFWDPGNPRAARASGPGTETLSFRLHFSGLPTKPLAFSLWAWEGGPAGTLREDANLSWTGQTWEITYNYEDPQCVAPESPVPLPGAFLLLGAGLVRLAAAARRRQA